MGGVDFDSVSVFDVVLLLYLVLEELLLWETDE